MFNQNTVKFLKTFLVPERFNIACAIISALISVIASLTVPILLGLALNILIGESAFCFHTISSTLLVLLFSIAISAFFQWLQGIFSARITYNVVMRIRDAIYKKIDRLSVETLNQCNLGDTSNLVINDVDLIGDGILQGAQQFFIGFSTILGTMVIMLWLSLPIALVVIILTPFSIVITAFIAKRSYVNFQKERSVQASYAATVEQIFANEGLLQTFHREDVEAKKALQINEELCRVGEASQFAGSLTNPGTRFVNNIVYAIVALVGCLTVLAPESTLTIGIVQSFLSYASQFSRPFYEMTGVLTQLQAAFASAERIAHFLNLQEMPQVQRPHPLPKPTKGTLSFQNVSFSYIPKKPVLSEVTFHAHAGEHIALVGHTGCGKTTLINLILGFYQPNLGNIFLDDINISNISKENLHKVISVVPQDSWIFSGTIFENIAFGKYNATKDEVIRAAEHTNAALFIEQLELGYDTYIGEDSAILSDGQKQLIGITRAYLKNAPILLLDEATSAIDTRTELLVQNALNRLMKGRTSITVAHRLSTIKKADTILVMEKGSIVEKGNEQELLKKAGVYAELYRSQWAGKTI